MTLRRKRERERRKRKRRWVVSMIEDYAEATARKRLRVYLRDPKWNIGNTPDPWTLHMDRAQRFKHQVDAIAAALEHGGKVVLIR